MDGAVKLYRRERSRKWQAAFQIDGQHIRISTSRSDLDEAKQAASDRYLEYKFRQKNGVPVVSKRFSDVAKLCIAETNKQLESGVGKRVYRDYVIVLEKYLIPSLARCMSPASPMKHSRNLLVGENSRWARSPTRQR